MYPVSKYVILILASVLVMSLYIPGVRSSAEQRHYGSDTGYSSLCRAICSRKDLLGPLECSFADFDIYKRSHEMRRDRRFGDFSFDDYLFMKLLGRNLEDRD